MRLFQNFILICVHLAPMLALSQTVTMDGPSSVYAGSEVHRYGFNVVSSYKISAGSFSVSNSNGDASIITEYTTIDTEPQSDGYHGSFLFNATFTSSGTATLTVSGGGGATKKVVVKEEWQRPPVVSIVTNEYCGSTAVFRLQDPPAGTIWWWQTNPTDEGSYLGTGDSTLLFTSKSVPLYIRASSTNLTQWSDPLYLGSIDVIKTAPPPATVAINDKQFYGDIGKLSVNAVDGATDYNWYNASGELVHQGQSYQNDFLKTETFQVITSNGCDATQGLPVTITIVQMPKIVVQGGGSTDLRQGTITLTTEQNYDTYSWIYSPHDDSYTDQVFLGRNSTCVAPGAGYYWVSVWITGAGTGQKSAATKHFKLGSEQIGNYVETSNILTSGISDPTSINTLSISQRSTTTQYFDGLGRPTQTVTMQGSPLKKDIVQSFGYDELGREATQYLPYAHNESNGWYKTSPVGSYSENYTSSPQYNFYQSASAVANDNSPYTKTVYETSSLNRILKKGSPGLVWQPDATEDPLSINDNTTKKRYLANAEFNVLQFKYDQASRKLIIPTARNYYDANQLSAKKMLDEHNNEVIEFVDLEGRPVCKKVQYGTDASSNILYASTYYIYDDFGNLVFVLPPEGVKALVPSSN